MKKQTEITMKDIAIAMELSRSTVSRALQDHPNINHETKLNVKKVAEKLGYKYNAVAASLRKSNSYTIGLIVPRISKYYQAAVITAIQNKLQEYKYNLIICQSNESPELENELINALYSSRVDGLIVSTTLYTTDFSHFDLFSDSDRPLIFFDRVPLSYPAHKVKGDDYKGGYLATMHLLEQGCRKIAHIGGSQSCNIYVERFNGYVDALAKYDIKVDKKNVFFHDLTKENALETCEKMFAMASRPDALFACNDTVALAATDYAKKQGIILPDEFKIVGYSNDPLTDIIEPSITSIEQYPYEVGTRAAELIIDLLQQNVKPGEKFISVNIPVELIKRNSSKN